MKKRIIIRKKSFTTRVVLSVLILCSLLFVLSLSLFYFFTKNKIEEMTYKNAELLTQQTIMQTEAVLASVTKLAMNYQWIVENYSSNYDSLYALTRKIIKTNDEIIGATIIFISKESKKKSIYSYRIDDSIQTVQLNYKNENYVTADWYQNPLQNLKPYWSEPYYDSTSSKSLMTTFSVPILITNDSAQKVWALLSIDLSLDWLTTIVSSVKILKTGYAFLLSPKGTFITHPNKELILNHTIFSYAKSLNNNELIKIGTIIQRDKKGFVKSTLNGKKRVMYYAPLPTNQWTLTVIFPTAEMYKPLQSLSSILIIVIILSLGLLSILLIRLMNQQLTPIRDFSIFAREVAKGNFSATLPEIHTKDELYELRDAFSFLRKNLNHSLQKLNEKIISQERFESELRIAKGIQMGMIPKIFPPFPQNEEIDLYAVLIQAKEVGGDLYDYFIYKNKLYFIIGDVAGKGVPAAMIMVMTRSLFRSLSHYVDTATDIMNELNYFISENNDTQMFVTLFLGLLDLSTGKLEYCNAGHTPPILIDDKINFFDVHAHLPLGLYEKFQYRQQCFQMKENSTLFLFTDGLIEAENKMSNLYGNIRLLSLLNKEIIHTPQYLIQKVQEDVLKHVNFATQSDDLTMLAITYNGKKILFEKKIFLSNKIEQIENLHLFIQELGAELNLENDLIMKLNIAMEEAVSNIMLYAYQSEQTDKIIEISVTFCREELIFSVIDSGIPFDPTEMNLPEVEVPADRRKIGGLGIYLIKTIMNDVSYVREDEKNILTMKKYIKMDFSFIK